ncbi:MAG: adenylate kinase family protein [Acidimicrobiia bacterium]
MEPAIGTCERGATRVRRDASALRVVLAGRPGAGKGIQGARLARRLGVPHLSTGDLLRHEITMQSPLGNAVERLVSAGRLVPTGLIVAIVESNLDDGGYVLDGFPRTILQAQTLLEREALAPTVAIEIVVSVRVAFGRLIRRGRADDDPTVVRNRLATYDTETAPAVDWLDGRGLLARVGGDDSPDGVERNVWRALEYFRRACDGSSLSDAYFVGNAHDAFGSGRVGRQVRNWQLDARE